MSIKFRHKVGVSYARLCKVLSLVWGGRYYFNCFLRKAITVKTLALDAVKAWLADSLLPEGALGSMKGV